MSDPKITTPTKEDYEGIRNAFLNDERWNENMVNDHFEYIELMTIIKLEGYSTDGPGWQGDIFFLQWGGNPHFVSQILHKGKDKYSPEEWSLGYDCPVDEAGLPQPDRV